MEITSKLINGVSTAWFSWTRVILLTFVTFVCLNVNNTSAEIARKEMVTVSVATLLEPGSDTTGTAATSSSPTTGANGNSPTVNLDTQSEAEGVVVPGASVDKADGLGDPAFSCPVSSLIPLRFTALSGQIIWNEHRCPGTPICDPCEFILQVPANYELIVEFHQVNLWFLPTSGNSGDIRSYDEDQWQASDWLILECVERTGACSYVRVLRDVRGRLPVVPLWAQDVSRLQLYLFVAYDKPVNDSLPDSKEALMPSSFNISYRSQYRSVLPSPYLLWTLQQPAPYTNYCGSESDLPSFLTCNMVYQCFNVTYNAAYSGYRVLIPTTDEDKCDYLERGCGQFYAPFRDECFSFEMAARALPNTEVMMNWCMLSEAVYTAAFFDPDVRAFVTEKILLLGRRHVMMGVERMTAGDSLQGQLYRFLWWSEPYRTVLYDPSLEQYAHFTHDCAAMVVAYSGHVSLRSLACADLTPFQYLRVCHKYNPTARATKFRASKLELGRLSATPPDKFPTKLCAGGYYVHPFHACDASSSSSSDASHVSVLGLRLLLCDNGARVHPTLTCDGYNDCGDWTDEKGCDSAERRWIQENPVTAGRFFSCKTSQEMIDIDKRCDGMADCADGSDEGHCERCQSGMELLVLRTNVAVCIDKRSWDDYRVFRFQSGETSYAYMLKYPQRPALEELTKWRVELDGYGGSYLLPLPEGNVQQCPETHVRCPNAYCIPTYMVNNGVYDCPFLDTDDEHVPDNFSCPGFYRCYRSNICVHNRYLCDGVHHCPMKDDERYCQDNVTACPGNCQCEGLAMVCREMVDLSRHFHVRYLDVSGVFQPRLDTLQFVGFLQFLNVSGCSLHSLPLIHMDHLKILDASRNKLRNVSSTDFVHMVSLEYLDLSDNPDLFTTQGLFEDILYSSGPHVRLRELILRNTGLTSIGSNVFGKSAGIRRLDLRDNNVVYLDKTSFEGLANAHLLQTDSIKLCCFFSEVFPESNANCQAPEDELSSCSDLLRTEFFRVGLWLLSLMAIVGNGVVLVYRVWVEPPGKSGGGGFRVCVTSLCVSDFCMGVYLMVIGSADQYYRGEYVWKERTWTHSTVCRVAGFLGLVSSEVSALIICLITLDRLLSLKFPLHRNLHLTKRSALAASLSAWLTGLVLASVPLLPAFGAESGREFYGQNGMCLPLPITRRDFPGQAYSFAMFIGLNFALFLLIGAGQLSVYWAVHSGPASWVRKRSQRRQQEAAIARRLFLVVFTDFCCWFPVGVLGLMASLGGVPIPGEVSVWTAIFVLPLNSALNPFLYTLNVVWQRHSKRKERQMSTALLSSLQTDVSTWSEDRVNQVMQIILTTHPLHFETWPSERVEALLRSLPPGRISEYYLGLEKKAADASSHSGTA